MIKKLKRKFILISMLSVLLVLVVTFSAINISNYVSVENDAKAAVSEVIRQGTEDAPPGEEPSGDPSGRIEIRDVHYFVVSFNGDGSINAFNTRHMFMFSEDVCKDLATKVYNDELTGGKYDTLRFNKAIKEDGLTYVGFVDIR
ncbi:MAG: hypothetical protein K5925_03815, partial [Bacilli bacterium]|nr:hypothetical protein [Bacilli bacterium]